MVVPWRGHRRGGVAVTWQLERAADAVFRVLEWIVEMVEMVVDV